MKTTSKTSAMALLLGVFLAGATLGNTISNAWGDGSRHERGRSGNFTDMLTRELDLNESQQEQVHAILEDSRSDMCAIWEAYRPRYDSLRMQIRERIDAVLTSEQREAHDQMVARRDSVRAARRAAADSSRRRNGC